MRRGREGVGGRTWEEGREGKRQKGREEVRKDERLCRHKDKKSSNMYSTLNL